MRRRGRGETVVEGGDLEREDKEKGVGRPERRRVRQESVSSGGDALPQEEGPDLPDFTPAWASLMLQGVCGDFYHHNDG